MIKRRADFYNYLHILIPKSLELHHVDKNRKNNKLNNLVFLHKKHHDLLHKKIKTNELSPSREDLLLFFRENKIKKYMLGVVSSAEWKKQNNK